MPRLSDGGAEGGEGRGAGQAEMLSVFLGRTNTLSRNVDNQVST